MKTEDYRIPMTRSMKGSRPYLCNKEVNSGIRTNVKLLNEADKDEDNAKEQHNLINIFSKSICNFSPSAHSDFTQYSRLAPNKLICVRFLFTFHSVIRTSVEIPSVCGFSSWRQLPLARRMWVICRKYARGFVQESLKFCAANWFVAENVRYKLAV